MFSGKSHRLSQECTSIRTRQKGGRCNETRDGGSVTVIYSQPKTNLLQNRPKMHGVGVGTVVRTRVVHTFCRVTGTHTGAYGNGFDVAFEGGGVRTWGEVDFSCGWRKRKAHQPLQLLLGSTPPRKRNAKTQRPLKGNRYMHPYLQVYVLTSPKYKTNCVNIELLILLTAIASSDNVSNNTLVFRLSCCPARHHALFEQTTAL